MTEKWRLDVTYTDICGKKYPLCFVGDTAWKVWNQFANNVISDATLTYFRPSKYGRAVTQDGFMDTAAEERSND